MKLNTDLCRDNSRSRNDYNQYAWLKIFDAMLKPRTIESENTIIDYLGCHRRDLPPAVWIEHCDHFPVRTLGGAAKVITAGYRRQPMRTTSRKPRQPFQPRGAR